MKIIHEKWMLLIRKLRQACASYRVTMAAVELFTLYLVIGLAVSDTYMRDSLQGYPVIEFVFYDWGIMLFFPVFILTAMFTESLFSYGRAEKKTKMARGLGFLFGILISIVIICGIQLTESEYILGIQGDVISSWCRNFVTGYILLMMLLILYICHRKSGVDFIEYLLHMLVNYAAATAVYLVLLIGINAVFMIVELLFLDGYSNLNGYITILLTGIYYAPACIVAMDHLNNDISDSLGAVLIKYVLTGLSVSALAVVYVYLIKILIMWEIPSNEIYGIVSGIFCLGMPIWMLDYFYRNDTKYMRFVQKLPYALIPLIPVQTYAICVRIYHNGMTPGRYMGVFMIVYEIAVLLVWRFWKNKLERVLLILAAGLAAATFIPAVNMYSVSVKWQQTFLETYYNKVLSQGELTEEEYERLKGAYQYLRWQPGMQNIIITYDIENDEFVQKLSAACDMEETELTQVLYHKIHCCQMVGSLDTDGYSGLDMLNQDETYESELDEDGAVDFAAFRFYKRGSETKEEVVVDLSGFVKRCFDYEKEHRKSSQSEWSDAMRPYIRIEIDENHVLYLNHFELGYSDGIKEGKDFLTISSMNISGVMLSK